VIYTFDDFELDAGRFVLRRHGELLKLEPKVLELLVLLLENRDRMLSKEELFKALWGKQFISDSVLPRCVHHVRQALGDTSHEPRYIKTVHGRGYRFSDEVAVEVADGQPESPDSAATDSVMEAEAPSSAGDSSRRWPGRSAIGLMAITVLVLLLLDQHAARRTPSHGTATEGAPTAPPSILGANATAEPVAALVQRQLQARNEDATYQFFINMGLQRRLTESCGDAENSVKVLEDSLASDPDFAPAWLGLGVATYAQVWACGLGGERTKNALAAFDRAVALAPSRTEAAMAEVTILTTLGKTDEAYELCQRYLPAHPASPNVLYNAQYVLRYAGFLQRSRKLLEELVAVDPGYLAAYAGGVSPAVYLYLGEWDRFLALLPDNKDSYSYYLRGLAERLRGRPEVARGWLESSVRAGQSSVFGRLSQALLAAIDDRGDVAERLVEEVALQRRRRGAADGEITYKQAEVLALAGRVESATRELRATVEEGFFCARCLELNPSFAAMHDDPDYREALGLARQRHLAFASRFGLVPESGETPPPVAPSS
jgi:DNA-binding winged helix-turn-helix (wHTH) protein/tetratricopeptide (TPR) repeat protein